MIVGKRGVLVVTPAIKAAVVLRVKGLTDQDLVDFASSIQGDVCSRAELETRSWFSRVEALFANDGGELYEFTKGVVVVLAQEGECAAATALCAEVLSDQELAAFAMTTQNEGCSRAGLDGRGWFNKIEALFRLDGDLPRDVRDAVFVFAMKRLDAAWA